VTDSRRTYRLLAVLGLALIVAGMTMVVVMDDAGILGPALPSAGGVIAGTAVGRLYRQRPRARYVPDKPDDQG
jgi:hypothetical protein